MTALYIILGINAAVLALVVAPVARTLKGGRKAEPTWPPADHAPTSADLLSVSQAEAEARGWL